MNTMIETPANVLGIELSGTLTEQDILDVKKTIYDRIAKDGTLGLVIDISGFEGMTSDALKADLKMESELLKELSRFPKTAFISDKKWLNILIQGSGKLFTSTELKTFTPDQVPEAIEFVSNLPVDEKTDEAKVTQLSTDRPDFLAFEISGKVTDEVMHPMVDDLMTELNLHDKIDLMVKIQNFSGFELALLKDSSIYKMKKLALKKVRRYAIVGANSWIKGIVKTVNPFFDMEIRTFTLDEEIEARAWINS